MAHELKDILYIISGSAVVMGLITGLLWKLAFRDRVEALVKEVKETETERETERDKKDEGTKNELRDFVSSKIKTNNVLLENIYFGKERGIVLETEMRGFKDDIKDIKNLIQKIFDRLDKMK